MWITADVEGQVGLTRASGGAISIVVQPCGLEIDMVAIKGLLAFQTGEDFHQCSTPLLMRGSSDHSGVAFHEHTGVVHLAVEIHVISLLYQLLPLLL